MDYLQENIFRIWDARFEAEEGGEDKNFVIIAPNETSATELAKEWMADHPEQKYVSFSVTQVEEIV